VLISVNTYRSVKSDLSFLLLLMVHSTVSMIVVAYMNHSRVIMVIMVIVSKKGRDGSASMTSRSSAVEGTKVNHERKLDGVWRQPEPVTRLEQLGLISN